MFIKANKKALSLMIGYVLLIVGVIIIGALVYSWLKTYVPTDSIECKEGVSIYIKDIECSKDTAEEKIKLNITLKNTGRFEINGYLIRAKQSLDEEIATKDLSGYIQTGEIIFKTGNSVSYPKEDPLKPSSEMKNSFEIDDLTKIPDIAEIEIIPTRFEKYNNKDNLAICNYAKVSEEVTC
jgi:hypothetical protein